jgi:hypothetical protein
MKESISTIEASDKLRDMMSLEFKELLNHNEASSD